MNVKCLKTRLFVALAMVLFQLNVFASTDLENQALQQIKNQLQALTPLIDEAQQQADPNTRLHFNYDAFRADLSHMEQGLDNQITQSHLEPRALNALPGDYRSTP